MANQHQSNPDKCTQTQKSQRIQSFQPSPNALIYLTHHNDYLAPNPSNAQSVLHQRSLALRTVLKIKVIDALARVLGRLAPEPEKDTGIRKSFLKSCTRYQQETIFAFADLPFNVAETQNWIIGASSSVRDSQQQDPILESLPYNGVDAGVSLESASLEGSTSAFNMATAQEGASSPGQGQLRRVKTQANLLGLRIDTSSPSPSMRLKHSRASVPGALCQCAYSCPPSRCLHCQKPRQHLEYVQDSDVGASNLGSSSLASHEIILNVGNRAGVETENRVPARTNSKQSEPAPGRRKVDAGVNHDSSFLVHGSRNVGYGTVNQIPNHTSVLGPAPTPQASPQSTPPVNADLESGYTSSDDETQTLVDYTEQRPMLIYNHRSARCHRRMARYIRHQDYENRVLREMLMLFVIVVAAVTIVLFVMSAYIRCRTGYSKCWR